MCAFQPLWTGPTSKMYEQYFFMQTVAWWICKFASSDMLHPHQHTLTSPTLSVNRGGLELADRKRLYMTNQTYCNPLSPGETGTCPTQRLNKVDICFPLHPSSPYPKNWTGLQELRSRIKFGTMFNIAFLLF